MDSTNKKLFYTSDNGQNITRSDLDFHPSELAFDEELPNVYVILDKVDTIRRVRNLLFFDNAISSVTVAADLKQR